MNLTFHFRVVFLLVIISSFGVGLKAATEVQFEDTTYHGQPGDTIELKILFTQPVPGGLEAYGLRLIFPEDAVVLTTGNIVLSPALDHNLFADGPADRKVGAGYALVEGFSDFTEGPYSGTEFVTFTITIPPNAPEGTYSLELGVAHAGANNFLDGDGAVIDDQLVFGSASLVIEGEASPLQIDQLAWIGDSGDLRLSFSGSPSGNYIIETSTDLIGWSDLTTVTAEADGTFEYVDESAGAELRRFYRARPE